MKRKIQIKNYLEEKNEPINKFNNFLKSIQSDLFRILEEKDEDDITFLTYEQKLADL